MKKTGIIIIGHGSRVEENNSNFLQTVEQLKSYTNLQLTYALLDFSPQTIQVATGQLIALGCQHIVVIPFLLFGGIHLSKHIPERIVKGSKNAKITFEICNSLGQHPLIFQALVENVASVKEKE